MRTTGPIEAKVKAATVASYLSGVAGLEVLEAVQAQPLLITPLPDWLEPVILGLLPATVTLVSGWLARHTPRTDQDARAASGPVGV